MNKELTIELNKFLGRASKATYASGGGAVSDPWRKGFKELEYTEGEWYYRDSYTGYLRSWGQEVVWYQGQPFWTCLYGGGMVDSRMDEGFAKETFTFFKKALSAGEKENDFQPRGPNTFKDGEWNYQCKVAGDIKKFSGDESISYQGTIVFTHEFEGGLVVGQDND
jgi:hypothetical protein